MAKEKRIDIDNCRMVGAYVPLPLLDYLYLYSYANNINKSELFRGLLTKWIQEKESETPQKYLLEKITNHIQASWDLAKLKSTDWNSFKREQCISLKSYGIDIKDVAHIIDNIRR